ncbi:conserved protein of unknown function [Rhodovastum atsumiense]|uniref:Uncharacterized protein n=1 Tax=Rhodovastum atsumiense TaxID=504468 RepID=A0A5M6IQY1_9PROT|nr:hypothetical protein [Rhodovastum atsumiense]KAA5610700.1 hypothetical protein F1189_18180 [Rhodovastum atsumiense]CAH2603298.1 conserved protein of unknown function [Rhodovastum atsumiense]
MHEDRSPIDRRRLATMLGAMVPVATIAAATPEGRPVTTLGLLRDLGSVHVPAEVTRIRTSGHSEPGTGGAEYVAVAGGGRHRQHSADGRWWVLAPDQVVTPARFGALPGANALAALQRAVNFIEEERGRGVLDFEGGSYPLGGGSLVIDPVRTGLRGNGARLTFQGGGTAAITCRSRPDTPPYGHAAFPWEGFTLTGPGRGGNVDGILFDTPTPLLSSRVLASGLAIHGFRCGIRMANRAYALKLVGLDIYDCRTCVEFSGGDDAGENISFVSCLLFNSELAVLNRGAELYFFGCSLDYCSRLFVGHGTVSFVCCHFEISRPTAAGQIPFELTDAGDLTLDGGMLMISGVDFDRGPAHEYMFLARNRYSVVRLRNVSAWNWRTTSGALLGGAGRLFCSGLAGGGNKQVPAVTKRDSVHNLFGSGGSFETASIAVNCWLTGGTRRLDRHGVAWANGEQEYGRASLSISDRCAASGKRSLRFARTGVGGGTESTLFLAAPIPPRCSVGLDFAWRVPVAIGGAGTAELYFQALFARFIGSDAAGLPMLGESLLIGEASRAVRLGSAMPGFERIAFTTTYSDPTSPCDGYAPDWATHVLLTMNPVNMPPGIEIHIDDLAAYAL